MMLPKATTTTTKESREATNTATKELIELVDQVKNLVSPDGKNFDRCEELLEKHRSLISDPCSSLKLGKATNTKLQLWRQGKNLPLDGELMEKQIKCLKDLKKGDGAFLILSKETEKIQDKYFKNFTSKQIDEKLAELDGKVPFVRDSKSLLEGAIKWLQRELGTEDNGECDRSICIDLWVDAHKALWNPNSEIRSKLETYLGQRLESYLDIGGFGSAAKLVAWYWPTSSGYGRPIRVDISGYHDIPPNIRPEIHQYKKEIELEMRLATKIAFLQREMALAIVNDLMGVRSVVASENGEDELSQEAENIVFSYTNSLLFPNGKPDNGLPMKLMASVPKLINDVQRKGSPIRAALSSEVLKEVGKCLFVIFYSTQIEKVELIKLQQTIDFIRLKIYETLNGTEQRRHGSCTNHIMDRMQEHELFNVALLFLLTFVCAVDPAFHHKLLDRWEPKDANKDTIKIPDFFNRLINENFEDLWNQLFVKKTNNISNDEDEDENPFTAIMKMSYILLRTYKGLYNEGEDEYGEMIKKDENDYFEDADRMKSIMKLRPFTFLKKLLNYNGIKHDGKIIIIIGKKK